MTVRTENILKRFNLPVNEETARKALEGKVKNAGTLFALEVLYEAGIDTHKAYIIMLTYGYDKPERIAHYYSKFDMLKAIDKMEEEYQKGKDIHFDTALYQGLLFTAYQFKRTGNDIYYDVFTSLAGQLMEAFIHRLNLRAGIEE